MNYYFFEREIGIRQAQVRSEVARSRMLAAWLGRTLPVLRPRRKTEPAAAAGAIGGRRFPPAFNGGEPARS